MQFKYFVFTLNLIYTLTFTFWFNYGSQSSFNSWSDLPIAFHHLLFVWFHYRCLLVSWCHQEYLQTDLPCSSQAIPDVPRLRFALHLCAMLVHQLFRIYLSHLYVPFLLFDNNQFQGSPNKFIYLGFQVTCIRFGAQCLWKTIFMYFEIYFR